MNELMNVVILAISVLTLFAIGEILYHFAKLSVEWTRKIAHIGTGVLSLLFPLLLKNHWSVFILCASFAVILFLSIRFNVLKSVNAIKRKSYGSLYYPLSVYCCFLFFQWFEHHYHLPHSILIFYIPILLLAICDPLAAFFGYHFPLRKFKVNGGTKSVGGSLGFCFGAILICFTGFFLAELPINSSFFLSISFIAVFTTLAEFFGSKGSDNLFIPFMGIATTFISFVYIL